MLILGIYGVYISIGFAFLGVAVVIVVVSLLMSYLTNQTSKYSYILPITLTWEVPKRYYGKEGH